MVMQDSAKINFKSNYRIKLYPFTSINKKIETRGLISESSITSPRGCTPKKMGRGVRLASQNPYPIYDQNLRFPLPYL